MAWAAPTMMQTGARYALRAYYPLVALWGDWEMSLMLNTEASIPARFMVLEHTTLCTEVPPPDCSGILMAEGKGEDKGLVPNRRCHRHAGRGAGDARDLTTSTSSARSMIEALVRDSGMS